MLRESTNGRSAGNNRAMWYAGVAVFVVLGVVLGFTTFPLFVRFGFAAAIAVIAAPFVVAVFVGAVPEFFSGVRGLRKDFGWRETCLALLFLSAATFEVRTSYEALSQPLDAWAILRLGPEMIVALILALRIATGKSSLKYLFSGLPAWLAVFCVVALASTAWSIVPSWTFYKSAEYLLDVLVGVVIYESITGAEDWLRILNWIWILYAIETSIPWLGAIFSPANAWDDLGRLKADFPLIGANNIGTTGALLLLVSISRLLWHDRRGGNRKWYWAVFIFGMASMLVAQTRNAIAGFVVGLIVIMIFAKRKWLGFALAAIGTPLFLLTSTGPIVETYLRRGQNDEAIHGLTGRLDWWIYAWQRLSLHPLTGLGAFAGGKFGVLAKVGAIDAPYLHSDWLEVAVGTSFWGVLPFVVALVGTWWFLGRGAYDKHLRPLERELAVECIGIVALLTVHSFLNNELSWHPPLLFLAVLGYAEWIRRKLKREGETVARSRLSLHRELSPPLASRV